MQIEGTTAMVTGGASGLGAAVVRLFSHCGARIVAVDVDRDLLASIRDETGCLTAETDVSDDRQVEIAVNRIVAEAGCPRILVNCAGVGAGGGLLTYEGEEQYRRFDRIMKVNLYDTFSTMRHLLRHMTNLPALANDERGVIINTSSASGLEGQAGQTLYAASKAAIAGMTLPAARDLGQYGIRVCTIAPGLFETPMLAGVRHMMESLERDLVFPKVRGQPPVFADLVRHICENFYINGEVIRLDAGLRVPPRATMPIN